MAFKTILAIVTAPETAEVVVAVASGLALEHDGHLDVLALGVDRSQPGYVAVGAGLALADWSPLQAEAEASAAAEAVHAALARQPAGLRWSEDSAVAFYGQATMLVGERAVFADLVVLAAPQGRWDTDLTQSVVEAALFQGRATVLICPEAAEPAAVTRPHRILLAWNDSHEALDAARRALPLLRQADVVDVTVVGPPASGPHRSDPGGALCQFLARHGVRAEVSVLARVLPRASDVLARHAADTAADLMVMGAYGHSRLREAVLGGATIEVLRTTRIPVLLAR
jgi:nucleotide-binding universal stress UspA family protein